LQTIKRTRSLASPLGRRGKRGYDSRRICRLLLSSDIRPVAKLTESVVGVVQEDNEKERFSSLYCATAPLL
jgi:hypothetical protein